MEKATDNISKIPERPRTAIITGASSGIGAACAAAFCRAGWRVAVCYRTHDQQAQALCELLNQESLNGGFAQAFYVDVGEEESVTELFVAVEAQLGGAQVLVNNAGVAGQMLFTDMTVQQWDDMFRINVRGAFLCSKAALRFMLREKSGCILNISSMWGQVGASCEVAYSAAKAALIGMTKALAKEEGLSGIRVNCIAPGVIDTPMMAGFSQQDRAELAQETPLCRLGTPEDVAQAALFLASDAAAFITGQVLGVNGGFVI